MFSKFVRAKSKPREVILNSGMLVIDTAAVNISWFDHKNPNKFLVTQNLKMAQKAET